MEEIPKLIEWYQKVSFIFNREENSLKEKVSLKQNAKDYSISFAIPTKKRQSFLAVTPKDTNSNYKGNNSVSSSISLYKESFKSIILKASYVSLIAQLISIFTSIKKPLTEVLDITTEVSHMSVSITNINYINNADVKNVAKLIRDLIVQLALLFRSEEFFGDSIVIGFINEDFDTVKDTFGAIDSISKKIDSFCSEKDIKEDELLSLLNSINQISTSVDLFVPKIKLIIGDDSVMTKNFLKEVIASSTPVLHRITTSITEGFGIFSIKKSRKRFTENSENLFNDQIDNSIKVKRLASNELITKYTHLKSHLKNVSSSNLNAEIKIEPKQAQELDNNLAQDQDQKSCEKLQLTDGLIKVGNHSESFNSDLASAKESTEIDSLNESISLDNIEVKKSKHKHSHKESNEHKKHEHKSKSHKKDSHSDKKRSHSDKKDATHSDKKDTTHSDKKDTTHSDKKEATHSDKKEATHSDKKEATHSDNLDNPEFSKEDHLKVKEHHSRKSHKTNFSSKTLTRKLVNSDLNNEKIETMKFKSRSLRGSEIKRGKLACSESLETPLSSELFKEQNTGVKASLSNIDFVQQISKINIDDTSSKKLTLNNVLINSNWKDLFTHDLFAILSDFSSFAHFLNYESISSKSHFISLIHSKISKLEELLAVQKKETIFRTLRKKSTFANQTLLQNYSKIVLDFITENVKHFKQELDLLHTSNYANIICLIQSRLNDSLFSSASRTFPIDYLCKEENYGIEVCAILKSKLDKEQQSDSWLATVSSIWIQINNIIDHSNEIINLRESSSFGKSIAIEQLATELFDYCCNITISFAQLIFKAPNSTDYFNKIFSVLESKMLPKIDSSISKCGEIEFFIANELDTAEFINVEKFLLDQLQYNFFKFLSSVQNYITSITFIGRLSNQPVISAQKIIQLFGLTCSLITNGKKFVSSIKIIESIQSVKRVDKPVHFECDEKSILSLDSNCSVSAGTLLGLINKLIDSPLDSKYNSTFMSTFESFCTINQLLDTLKFCYNHSKVDNTQKIVNLLVQILSEINIKWNKKTLISLNSFVQTITNPENYENFVILKSLIELKLDTLIEQNYIESLHWNLKLTMLDISELIMEKDSKTSTPEKRLATQLTLIDIKLFSKIKLSEVFNQNWNRSSTKYLSCHFLNWLNFSDDLSHWVSWSILSCVDLTSRVKTISFFINVADALYNMNNFNGMLCIISGIQSGSVSRLEHSFNSLKQKDLSKLSKMTELLNQQGSYKNYREEFKSKSMGICIPFSFVAISDFTFIDEGNENMTNEDLINFKKREIYFKHFNEFERIQDHNTLHSFLPSEPLFTALYGLPHNFVEDNDSLFSISQCLEPRRAPKESIFQ